MRKFLLLFLLPLLPLFAAAQQPVTPVISPEKQSLRITQPYSDEYPIKTIRIGKETLSILPATAQWLTFGGNYTFSAAARSANSLPALQDPYDIFRTGILTRHSISLQARIKGDHWPAADWVFALKAGSSTENTVIADNRNASHNISLSAIRYLRKISIEGGYSYFSSRFSNDNSNGCLNRVYQNALLTPTSNQTDNPWFLLKENGHFADRVQRTGNLSLQKKEDDLTFGIANALDAVDNNSNQSLKPGTAFFPIGLFYTRMQNDRHYTANPWIAYKFGYEDRAFSSTARLNYIYNNEAVKIVYPTGRYSYHRVSSDAAFTVNSAYYNNALAVGLNTGNKFYASNTSGHNKYFLPELSGFIAPKNLFGYRLFAKLAGTFTSFCSEPPINQTFSPLLLTQLTPQEAYRFMPFTEVSTFKDLSPIQHQEFTTRLELDYRGMLYFNADLSIRNTRDNVFPIYDNNQLTVKNIADTRYKGLELYLRFDSKNLFQGPRFSNSISFYKYSNTTTSIRPGYGYQPIAGFSTIYKALVKGQPVGVILSNSNNQPSIIGNPTPDYTLKFSHVMTWKAFAVNLDWEYRKGGDLWNGTAATLDDYGHGAPTTQNNTGKAQSYIQKGDNLRIHTLSLGYDIKTRKYLQQIRLNAYAQNLLLWSAYKGVDPNQLLFDQPGSSGLDFFNLPSPKTFGISASIQF